MLIIPVKEGESIDKALKRFKRKFDRTGKLKSLDQKNSKEKTTFYIIHPVLKHISIYTSKGKVNSIGNITVRGKSGTMHYIRGLAGYVCKEDIPVMAFAIFTADLDKRKENSSNNFERPKGSKAWLSRAIIQERQIIRKIIDEV